MDEVALYEDNLKAAHSQILVYIQKRALSTFQALAIFSEILGVKIRDIGYAGLKDKASTSRQYLTLPRVVKNQDCKLLLEKFQQVFLIKGIEILKISPFQNKLRIGHLRGNNFTLKLSIKNTEVFHRALERFEKFNSGFANYFGPQRFGKWGDNYLLAIKRLKSGAKFKRGVDSLLLSSLQSHYFNLWLALREKLSLALKNLDYKMAYEILAQSDIDFCKNELEALDSRLFNAPLALLPGDLMMHYPHGRLFELSNISDSARFSAGQISLCGELASSKFLGLNSSALKTLPLSVRIIHGIYRDVLEIMPKKPTSCRYAFIWVQNLKLANNELSFYLPKGVYASTLLAKLVDLCTQESVDV